MAKMTPFRSYVVIIYTTGAVAFMGTFNLRDGTTTYMIVSSSYHMLQLLRHDIPCFLCKLSAQT